MSRFPNLPHDVSARPVVVRLPSRRWALPVAAMLATAGGLAAAMPGPGGGEVPPSHRGWLVPRGEADVVMVPAAVRPPGARHCDPPVHLPPDAGFIQSMPGAGGPTVHAWPRLSTLEPTYTGCQWELVQVPEPAGPVARPVGVAVFDRGRVIARFTLLPAVRALAQGLPPVCRYVAGRPVGPGAAACASIPATGAASQDAACAARQAALPAERRRPEACPFDFRSLPAGLPALSARPLPICAPSQPWARIDVARLPPPVPVPDVRELALMEPIVLGGPPAADLVREAVRAGYPVDRHLADHQTLLHLAAAHHDEDLVRWLLDAGASPHVRDTMGATPLLLALSQARLRREPGEPERAQRVAELLLDRGAVGAVALWEDFDPRSARQLAERAGLSTLVGRLPVLDLRAAARQPRC